MRIPLLGDGYIELIETWGSDERIIEAARMSTDKGFLGWKPEIQYVCPECEYTLVDNQPVDRAINCPANPSHGRLPYKLVHHGDEKLLRYLYEHKHMTPFEMAGAIVEVQAPIFVFREWHRHRTQSFNELSARYTELPDLFYVPSDDRLLMSKQSNANKQSSDSAATFTQFERDTVRQIITSSCQIARKQYEGLLALGVAREVARVVIPVGQFSRMRASANLRNWLQFLTLRMAPGAQWEIRQYANALGTILYDAFPHTWELFADERRKHA